MKRFEVVFEAPVYYLIAKSAAAAKEAAEHFMAEDAPSGMDIAKVEETAEGDAAEEYFVWHGDDDKGVFEGYHTEEESGNCDTCKKEKEVTSGRADQG